VGWVEKNTPDEVGSEAVLCLVGSRFGGTPLELPRRDHPSSAYGNPVYPSTRERGKLPFSIRIETIAATAA
jgi:hypothetical protein